MMRRLRILTCAFFSAMPCAAGAQSPAPDSVPEQVRRFVEDELARTQPGLRAQITVGDIDARMRLAPCDRTEAFLRPGTRLWGRGYVGYRCLQRPGWSVSVPVDVHLFGPGLVALQSLPALQTIGADAVELREIDLTRESGGVVKDAAQLADKVATRPIEAGQAIPLNALRTVPAVNQGEPVKVVGIGSGFSIATEGTAMSSAAPGDLVRVRTESGRTIAGIARRGRIVEVSF
jgi:flagella basal body P-ring formation protein FlgA